jgi:hypothetical protein
LTDEAKVMQKTSKANASRFALTRAAFAVASPHRDVAASIGPADRVTENDETKCIQELHRV